MEFQTHIDRVVQRTRSFYSKSEPGHLLVNVHFPVDTPPLPALWNFDLDRQLREWLDYKMAVARPIWQAKQGLDDDSIPAICPHFGIAEHSAWLGMEAILQEITSLPIPLLKSPADFAKLKLSEQDKWFRYMKTSYEYLHSKKDGSFVLSLRGTMAPMDIANALCGDDLFLYFLQEPDFCHRLMNWLVNAISWYFGHLQSWADSIDGGYVYFFTGGWMPPRTMGHLSNDTAMLCSSAIYEQFGFPYEAKLVESYSGVLYHVHNEKIHYVPRLAGLPHLSMLEVSHDPKTIMPIDDLARIFQMTGSANLMLRAGSEQVRAHISELKERNIFLQIDCHDRKDAEDILSLVRDRSKALA
jgi:hypothetical protein